uniref:Uncharacterized protein n=1 Tax=Hucho hucho TaxID=62062 RepID=A0A4W5RGA9_9TELE
MFSAASSYLPAQVSGVMSQERAFATVRLLVAGQRNVCTLAMIQKLPRLLVASSDGQTGGRTDRQVTVVRTHYHLVWNHRTSRRVVA